MGDARGGGNRVVRSNHMHLDANISYAQAANQQPKRNEEIREPPQHLQSIGYYDEYGHPFDMYGQAPQTPRREHKCPASPSQTPTSSRRHKRRPELSNGTDILPRPATSAQTQRVDDDTEMTAEEESDVDGTPTISEQGYMESLRLNLQNAVCTLWKISQHAMFPQSIKDLTDQLTKGILRPEPDTQNVKKDEILPILSQLVRDVNKLRQRAPPSPTANTISMTTQTPTQNARDSFATGPVIKPTAKSKTPQKRLLLKKLARRTTLCHVTIQPDWSLK
ncbi:hypothetical protein BV22DRAFT_1135209 [Leucogyrophana mollusca]|uniref:Uncharacterized protein n=1 Tax=Leucogyrophana mollusca TaxID=85980 RepID=A0ACB8AWC5_9AGAM|nr:hypothetical protein BV22DRAFT_1135209 [Leucogyrophana mollusca]